MTATRPVMLGVDTSDIVVGVVSIVGVESDTVTVIVAGSPEPRDPSDPGPPDDEVAPPGDVTSPPMGVGSSLFT